MQQLSELGCSWWSQHGYLCVYTYCAWCVSTARSVKDEHRRFAGDMSSFNSGYGPWKVDIMERLCWQSKPDQSWPPKCASALVASTELKGVSPILIFDYINIVGVARETQTYRFESPALRRDITDRDRTLTVTNQVDIIMWPVAHDWSDHIYGQTLLYLWSGQNKFYCFTSARDHGGPRGVLKLLLSLARFLRSWMVGCISREDS